MWKRVFGHPRSLIRASLSAHKTIGYYRMYEWRAKTRMIFAHVQGDFNLRILHKFEGAFSLDDAHVIKDYDLSAWKSGSWKVFWLA